MGLCGWGLVILRLAIAKSGRGTTGWLDGEGGRLDDWVVEGDDWTTGRLDGERAETTGFFSPSVWIHNFKVPDFGSPPWTQAETR